jgi:hypothetical protein
VHNLENVTQCLQPNRQGRYHASYAPPDELHFWRVLPGRTLSDIAAFYSGFGGTSGKSKIMLKLEINEENFSLLQANMHWVMHEGGGAYNNSYNPVQSYQALQTNPVGVYTIGISNLPHTHLAALRLQVATCPVDPKEPLLFVDYAEFVRRWQPEGLPTTPRLKRL